MLETSETAEAAPQEKKSARNIKTDFYSLIEEDKELSKIFKAGKKDN
jgi:truncated hemoglobin YjbI